MIRLSFRLLRVLRTPFRHHIQQSWLQNLVHQPNFCTYFRRDENTRRLLIKQNSTRSLVPIGAENIEPELLIDDEVDEEQGSIRNVLYKSDVDHLLLDLQRSESLEELQSIIREHGSSFSQRHVTQSVIVLWDLLKRTLDDDMSYNPLRVFISPEYEKVFEKFVDSAEFQSLVDHITKKLDIFSPDELSCILLYLTKMGFSIRSHFSQQIIEKFLENEEVPLAAFSRFIVAANSELGYYPLLMCATFVPKIDACLEQEQLSNEDLVLITTNLHHLIRIVSTDITMSLYQAKVIKLLESGQLNSMEPRNILRIANFLLSNDWNGRNAKLTRDLVLIALQKGEKFSVQDVLYAQKILQIQLEPISLLPLIVKRADTLLCQSPSNLNLISCSLLHSGPEKRISLMPIIEQAISNRDTHTNWPSLVKALRMLKSANISTIDNYWSRLTKEIRKNRPQTSQLIRYIYYYMHFNNNLAGTYRHRAFELQMIEYVIDEIQNQVSGLFPLTLSKLAAFVIAYGNDEMRQNAFGEEIVRRLEEMKEQLSIFDCLHISRGIQVAQEMRYRYYIPVYAAPLLVRLDNLLNSCMSRHLEEDKTNPLSLNELNIITRAYVNRNVYFNTNLFNQVINLYESNTDPPNSRIIKDICHFIMLSGYVMPHTLSRMADYVRQNAEHITGITVEKVLSAFFYLGQPIDDDRDFHATLARIFERDFAYMSGLTILQACLALCYFKILPETLIQRVFNIEFIKQLELEVQTCYSREKYPERIFDRLMQLNRAVCLDMPEANVPWFQQNYIEAQMTKQPNIETKLGNDVKNILLEIVDDPSLIKCNHVTPYGYKLDFVLHQNKDKKFVPPPKDASEAAKVTKIAILPLTPIFYCENMKNQLKGFGQLRQRHLEILGYKLINVSSNEWNLMYLTVPGARKEYVSSLLGVT